MELMLDELNTLEDVLAVYEIYKHCMYLPTKEKFCQKAVSFLQNEQIKIFVCRQGAETKGVAVLLLQGQGCAEILGIAVAAAVRGKGIGTYMLCTAVARCGLTALYAQTDDEAVGFYRKNGFAAVQSAAAYGGAAVTRYHCSWQKE